MNQLLKRKSNELSVKKKKGFTLIELIIVIAIIAIIAAIAIPKFGQVKANANLTSDQANAKIIATAAANAVSDGLVPTGGDVTTASNFATYIDGGNIPAVKSDSSKKFFVVYSAGTGTKVYIESAAGKQVYPVS